MKNKDLKKIVKIILIAGIILCGVAQILPWGKLEVATPGGIPIPDFANINLNYFHWGGIQINPKLPGVPEWIFTPTETDFFSGVTGSPELYGWAFAALLVYLIVPLGIISLGTGIVAYKKVGQKRSKNSLYAAVFSIMAVFLFIVFIQLSLLLNIEEVPSSILHWSWSTGFYLMILSAILFFIAYATIWKIYSEEEVVQTPKKEKGNDELRKERKEDINLDKDKK